jgi:tRNA-dihydrouridine synthase B
MSCNGNNATAPSPAIAPGMTQTDARRIAERLVKRFGTGGADARLHEQAPGFDAPFFQAGLAGYSDAAMRLIARRHGCPMCVTEALLDRTLLAGGRGFAKADLGDLHDNVPGGADDTPLTCQIMGSDPREMAAAALKAVEQGRRGDKDYRVLAYAGRDADFARDVAGSKLRLPGGVQINQELRMDHVRTEQPSPRSSGLDWSENASHVPEASFAVIDVNLACPVKKVSTKARGGHWLAEPVGAIKILEAVREAVPASIPVTVKMRRSFDDTPEMVEAFEIIFEAAYAMGCAWVTVHARTVEQKYVGPSRWDVLRDLCARNPDKLIFGSGDVWGVDDIFRMIDYTGVSAVSVARGCIGNPWIFRQARDLLAGREPHAPTVAEQRAVLDEHFALLLRLNRGMRQPEFATAKSMRKFGIRFAAHHPQAEQVRLRMIAVNSLNDWQGVLNDWYSQPGLCRVSEQSP